MRLVLLAYHKENAGPPAIARCVGWHREYVWRIIKQKGEANGQ